MNASFPWKGDWHFCVPLSAYLSVKYMIDGIELIAVGRV